MLGRSNESLKVRIAAEDARPSSALLEIRPCQARFQIGHAPAKLIAPAGVSERSHLSNSPARDEFDRAAVVAWRSPERRQPMPVEQQIDKPRQPGMKTAKAKIFLQRDDFMGHVRRYEHGLPRPDQDPPRRPHRREGGNIERRPSGYPTMCLVLQPVFKTLESIPEEP